MDRKIAILGTSQARDTLHENGKYSGFASAQLLGLIEDGYEVYIVSTRTRLFPEGADACLFELLPEERFFVPGSTLSMQGGATSEALLDLWERVADFFAIEVPPTDCRYRTWMDIRARVAASGIVTN